MSNQWVRIEHKGAVLVPQVLDAADGDTQLMAQYRADFAGLLRGHARDAGGILDTHLRFHRRVNLPNLLARLDTATMLAGVEGRTPLADAVLGGVAESLPMRFKFEPDPTGRAEPATGRTKIALRGAFCERVGVGVATRAKASFPLPFEGWLGAAALELGTSPFARAVFTPAAISAVTQAPERSWHLLWPMANLARWGDRWGWESISGSRTPVASSMASENP